MNKINPEANRPNNYKVSFDQEKGSSYLCCQYSCISCLSCIGILCLPCSPWFSKWTMNSQDCTIDDNRIHFKTGWFNKEDKLIPLDRIQDVNIIQGYVHRLFGVSQLDIQTAGNSGQAQNGAEARLIAPLDPEQVRKEIMDRRDRVVLGSTSSGIDYMKPSTQPAPITMDIVQELREIKVLVRNIESKVPTMNL
ncbi:hypothetical protein HDV06_002497 [Boothiomyces sp. JEL0866]|nr:hypothetical protein HDV06_002497 [Boothiomyces sp. JEL0866]